MRRRVVVTGLGVLAPPAVGRNAFWEALKAGKSAVKAISHFDVSDFRTQIAATIDPLLLPEPDLKTDSNLCDLSSLIALLAAREALLDADLGSPPPDTGIILGSAIGGIRSLDQQFENFYVKGKRNVMPYTVPRTMPNASSSLLAIELGIRGPNQTVCTACSSSSHAIGWAYRLISQGMMEVCLSGGTECPVSPGHLQAWDRLRALANDNDRPARACRPFSANRRGLVLGEGAAILILEERERALARRARIYGELVGYGANCDAQGMLQASWEGEKECLRKALEDAGQPERIPDYISAHATGTWDGDRAETIAIRQQFGPCAYRIPVSSIKSMIGHSLGASGALATVATLLAMQEGVLPPTVNLEQPDPECDLDYVPGSSRKHSVEFALVNAFAFGGSNAVLAVSRGV